MDDYFDMLERKADIKDIIDISAGSKHVLALKNDGSVWIWNALYDKEVYSGQQNEDLTLPVQVKEISKAVAISAIGGNSIVQNENGSVYLWGLVYDGRSTVPKLHELSDVMEITSGDGYFLALKNDGSLLGIGNNGSGQIGNGNFITKKGFVKSVFSLNPLEFVNVKREDTPVFEFDKETTKELDIQAKNIMETYGSNQYEKFVQKDKMDVVTVDNPKDLLNAIKPNREIVLKAGKTYNLAEALTKGEYGYLYEGENSDYVSVEGNDLIFRNLENLIIRSESDKQTYLKSPGIKYALRFETSKNIVIDGINAEQELDYDVHYGPEVFSFYFCKDIYINNSALVGGYRGLSLIFVDNFVFENSLIEDCIYFPVSIMNSNYVLFKESKLRNNNSDTLVSVSVGEYIIFSCCDISNNVAEFGFTFIEVNSTDENYLRRTIIVSDTVIDNNQFKFLKLYVDDVYFKNTSFKNNLYTKGAYEYDFPQK